MPKERGKKMKVLLCIDDTDNLESAGTGEMLQEICKILTERNLCTEGFVSRHQLFIHESIKYTSHNSSMCCELENVKRKNIDEIIKVAAEYLEQNAAEGSDPGVCLVQYEELKNPQELVEYGMRAKNEVLTKEIAYEFAARYPQQIHLSEHGGTGEGVIGALAGCGLRISGSDGKIKGKLKPDYPNEVVKVKDFCQKFHIENICDKNWVLLDDNAEFIFSEDTKAFMHEGKRTVMVKKCDKGAAPYVSLEKKELQDMGVGY